MTDIASTVERFHTGRVIMLATVAALGGFLFGFDTAVVNGTVYEYCGDMPPAEKEAAHYAQRPTATLIKVSN